VHGANRLASNSLLEAVVFGRRAGRAMRTMRATTAPVTPAPRGAGSRHSRATHSRSYVEHCGILRDRAGLESAIGILEKTEWAVPAEQTLAAAELRNMHLVALLIARCALWREESRGATTARISPKTDGIAHASRISLASATACL